MRASDSGRRKRVWTVADFARHAFDGDASDPACRRARRILVRLDAKHGGKILIATPGTNRLFTFYPAVLARLEPDLFAPIESLEFRVEDIEDRLDEAIANERMIAAQVRQNTSDVATLQRRMGRSPPKNVDRGRSSSAA